MRLVGFVFGVTLVGVLAVLYLRSVESPFMEHDPQTIPELPAETRVASKIVPTEDPQALEGSALIRNPETITDEEKAGDGKPDEEVENLITKEVESPKAEAPADVVEKHSSTNEIVGLSHEDIRIGRNFATDPGNETSGNTTENTTTENLPLEVFSDSPPQTEKPAAIKTPSETLQPSWQVFWKPFYREHSANGFAARLREVTGIDIHVKRQGQEQGQYIIGFYYQDETERQRNIDIIENRTGLRLNITESP